MGAVDERVHFLQEADGFEVLAPAIFVGDPLAFLAGIIEIEHRGDGIDAQSIEMEFFGPIKRVVDEVGQYLDAPEIVDGRVPVGMKTLTRVGMFVKRCPVKQARAVLVGWKMRRNPVEDHADADLVGAVDEAGETFRIAETGGRGIKPGRLVTRDGS